MFSFQNFLFSKICLTFLTASSYHFSDEPMEAEALADLPQPVSAVSGGEVILKLPADRDPRARAWCFTVNNYNQSDKDSVVSLVSGSEEYIYGFEEGDSKTPHIQGYVRFKNQVRFSTLKKKLPQAHLEKAKGTPRQNFDYCSKDGDYVSNMVIKLTRQDMLNMVGQEYKDVVWKSWQTDLLDIIGSCSSKRTIHWVYEKTGNVGKTFLARFLCLQPGTVVCEGKKSDIFNQVNSMIEAGTIPKLVIVDCPRTCIDFLSYTAIECLKNGLLYSGKYEGGLCVFPSPTVLCFANEKPKQEKLSLDRWHIYKIQDDTLYKRMI